MGRRLAALAGLAAGLLGFFLLRYPIVGFRLPMGPDAPVYVWWANLAQREGLSVANWRPGAPALTLTLGGVLGRSQSEIVAGLGGALAAALGLAVVAMVRRGSTQPPWVTLTAGMLAGTWAVHLAGGYFGNLALALTFVAALALLAGSGPWTTTAAALLIGAGGLAHPMFALVGVLVLVLGAAFVRDGERGRLLAAAGGGAALTGAGLLTLLWGARPLAADTSADAFLRRAGFADELRSEFLERFRAHWGRYVPWLSLPLAWYGRGGSDTPLRPVLGAWTVVALGGLALSLAFPVIPGVRLVAFAFAIPILAALGLARLADGIARRWVAIAVVCLALVVLVGASAWTWSRERPYASPELAGQVAAAVEGLDDPDTIVVVVNEPDPERAPFRVTNWGNVIRAALPADTVRRTFLYVGEADRLRAGEPTLSGDPITDALSRTYLADLQAAGVDAATAAVVVLDDLGASDAAAPLDSPWTAVAAGVSILLLLGAVGYGWARAVVTDAADAVAVAPAFGAAVLMLAGMALDRAGVRLTSEIALATVIAVLCGGIGLRLLARRMAGDTADDAH